MEENTIQQIFNILNNKDIPKDVINSVSKELEEIFYNNNELSNEFDILQKKLSILWGNDYDQNYLLVQRALKWLNFTNQSTDNNANEEIDAILKLLQLGKLLSEDLILQNENFNNTVLTKPQALEERNKLMQNKDFMTLLNNKTMLGHPEAVEKINKLNFIIANN